MSLAVLLKQQNWRISRRVSLLSNRTHSETHETKPIESHNGWAKIVLFNQLLRDVHGPKQFNGLPTQMKFVAWLRTSNIGWQRAVIHIWHPTALYWLLVRMIRYAYQPPIQLGVIYWFSLIFVNQLSKTLTPRYKALVWLNRTTFECIPSLAASGSLSSTGGLYLISGITSSTQCTSYCLFNPLAIPMNAAPAYMSSYL